MSNNVLGTTGESATLSLTEQNLIIAHAKKIINNRVPIVVGIGGNNTAEVVNRIDSMDFSGSPTWKYLSSCFFNGRDISVPHLTHFIPMQNPELTAKYILDKL